MTIAVDLGRKATTQTRVDGVCNDSIFAFDGVCYDSIFAFMVLCAQFPLI